MQSLTANGIYFTPDKQEAYFNITLELPRVGQQTFTFTAERYMVRVYNDANVRLPDRLTDWCIIRTGNIPHGVGEKNISIVYEKAKALVTEWIASDEFAPAFSEAVTNYIVNLIRNRSTYSVQEGREALDKYQDILNPQKASQIADAIDHLDKSQRLLATL